MEIDKIVRSKRKTLALQVTKDAELVVRAPLCAPDVFIHSFIQKHIPWIEKKQQEMRAKKATQRQFLDGELFLFLGKQYQLAQKYEKKYQGVTLIEHEGVMEVVVTKSESKKIIETWYKKQVRAIIIPRVHAFAKVYGLGFNDIRITSAGTRWGSCSGKRNLSFSWRLIMAPREVIDYVIVHELTHLTHMNHSKRFWADVAKRCPRYKEYKTWLKENARNAVW